MQEETTDKRSRWHQPCSATDRDHRDCALGSVMDGAAASRSIAKKIQSVTSLSVYACTIRRRFQQSGIPEKRPLLRLPWMETTGICTANGVMNGGHGQRNEMVLCLLMNPTSACNITRFGFELGDTVVTGC
ncbi:hypothetical protein TNCV_1427251 [Trichonephila clavipes]|nr:hypothetical protein TNCV_1427251 [Trichonephila clavipes]